LGNREESQVFRDLVLHIMWRLDNLSQCGAAACAAPQQTFLSANQSQETQSIKPFSDAAAFRKALFDVPYPLELDF
jgi:hypothetical protein